ncbi:poly-gamma-glutamate synthase PgsB [Thiotrichales bacterium 19S3-7]|nr:poly-gamma-glutamate synthase PgsB [Thiotrichales bacterium 19S3-7]MCF6801165.1 poly-gamma-glutamate synthase PgsB [Thiotrichales bacterium 19S3-11]
MFAFFEYKPILLILIILFLLLVIFYILEELYHLYTLKQIPYRIHVNGTRGKSSVARLIAAGLRAGDIATCCKTTGTLARFIDTKGNETPVFRVGFTNIIEQVVIIRKARKLQTQALVIECMALQPLLQSLCELKIVRSTHGVLTNARPDHLDVMGPEPKDVALALAATVPVKGKYFTPETIQLPVFQMATKDRKSELFHISENDINSVTDEDVAGFCYAEFKENIALALKVCASLGVSKEVAIKGMWEAKPDPGAMTKHDFSYESTQILFANGFAANDPVSTEILWHKLLDEYQNEFEAVLMLNCRDDRQDRTLQFVDVIPQWRQPKAIVLIGTGCDVFTKAYKRKAKTQAQLIDLEEKDENEIIQSIAAKFNAKKVLLVGIGNIYGVGLRLIDVIQLHQTNGEKENKEEGH